MEIQKTQRIEALDIFRALTMFFMLFVNDIAGLKDIPHWLQHARWDEDMLGFSDIIFPGFLFAMGMAIPYAIQNRLKKGESLPQVCLHIFWRTIALLVMGLFTVNLESLDGETTGLSHSYFALLMVLAFFLVWNLYPKSDGWKRWLFLAMKAVGIGILIWLYLIYKGHNGSEFGTRWWGILGLIGWTYLVCAVIYLFTRKSIVKNSIALIVLIICSLISATGEFWGWPVISTIAKFFPSQCTLHSFGMAGMWAGLIMQKYANKENPKRFYSIFAIVGVAMLIAAIVSHQYWIISKIQATPTWLFYCCAIFFPLFILIYWLTDVKGKSRWFAIIKPAGTATLTCYIIPYAWYNVQSLFDAWYPHVLYSGVPGLIRSAVFSLVIIGIAWVLMKGRIRLKI